MNSIKNKTVAIGAVIVMCMTALAGMCIPTEVTDAASQTYGSTSNPLSYINYTLKADGSDAGSTWYVSTGSYVTFNNYEDGGGSDEFGSIVKSATTGFGLDSSGNGRILKAGTVTLNCYWWNGTNEGNFTLTVIGVGNNYYPHTLHYDANGGSGSCADTVSYTDASGNSDVIAGNGYGLTKSGYYIESWNTLANGSGGTYEIGSYVSVPKNGTVTLYAQWAVDNRNGTATSPLTSLERDVAYSDADKTFYIEVGSTVDLKGWGDEPEGITWASGTGLGLTSYVSGGFEYDSYGLHGTISQAGTLETTWNELEDPEGNYAGSFNITIVAVNSNVTYTVTYDGNGNTSGTMTDTVITYRTSGNLSVSLSACGYSKSGYSFTGWLVNGTVYQPGESITVGANAVVTATAQWSKNTLSASANSLSCISGQAYSNKITASANNGASLSYAIKSCSGGSASVNSSGTVTYTAPTVNATTSYSVTVTVTASFATGDVLTKDVSFSTTVDPVLSFTNAATSGTLSVKGA